MRGIRSVVVECRQIICSFPFWVSVFFVIVLCLAAPFYQKNSEITLSVFETLFSYLHGEIQDTTFITWNFAFLSGINSNWLGFFTPVLVALPAVYIYQHEFIGGFKCLCICREGKTSYVGSHIVAACVSGGLILIFGFTIFGVFAFSLFPSMPEGGRVFQYGEISKWLYLGIFLQGCFYSMPAVALSGRSNNRYLVLGIPFLLRYIWNQTWLKNDTWTWIPSPGTFLDIGTDGSLRSALTLGIIFVGMCVMFAGFLVKRRDLCA